MKDTNPRRFIVFVFLVLLILIVSPADPLAAEEYTFERMWPTLQQPWYFNSTAIAVDENGNVYVANWNYYTIKKFTSAGQFVTEWSPGDYGGGEPFGLGVDRNGFIFVAGSGAGDNQCVLKFTLDGQFVSKWGSKGTGKGEFRNPQGIAVDGAGNVYVVDVLNNRIQKFSATHQFVTEWGTAGSGDGQFSVPSDITIDQNGYLYVVDNGNSRIQKFGQDGSFVTKWGSSGSGDGEFYFTSHDYTWHEGGFFGGGITTDKGGNICILDNGNHRIQKFTSDGKFLSKWTNGYGGRGIAAGDNGNVYVGLGGNVTTYGSNGELIISWGSSGSGEEEFNWPGGISISGDGSIYVADSGNGRIQKFTADGAFITTWYGAFLQGLAMNGNGDLYGVNPGEKSVYGFKFDGESIGKWKYNSSTAEGSFPTGIAIDVSGNIYVADYEDYCIKKFSPDGQLILRWGKEGTGDGEFSFEKYNGPDGIGIETDGEGYIYVADLGNHRIQKFTLDGAFVLKWGSEGFGDGIFYYPRGVAVDKNHDVYVVDQGRYLQKFTSNGNFLYSYDCGLSGNEPGQFNGPIDLAVADGGKIYVVDRGNNRIQVLSSEVGTLPGTSKAIIVAGGGPYESNNIWDATGMCTNYAYRALTYQGYTKDSIYYLSADTDLDLDGNGSLDDVDADATNANLQYAIKTWALDAEDLFIYMVDHGGNGTFRMGETELLGAADLDVWLDTIQETIPGGVTMVYDACESGSFLPYLLPPSGKQRILATSTSSGQESIFVGDGTVSFSFLFWGHMFNGDSFYDSFVSAKKSVSTTYNQTPQLDGDGNGVGNEKADKDAANLIRVGNETKSAGDVPIIGGVSPAQSLQDATSATLYADQVTDANGISRVWAVITPPDYSTGSTEDPVTDLPTIDLNAVGNNRYEATYTNFSASGIYNIAVFAMDRKGVLSLPVQTSVTTTSNCLTVGAGLGIQAPCAEYNGNRYGFLLDFYRHPDDPAGYYWKLVIGTLTTGDGGDCLSIGTDLSMLMSCVAYNGTQYGFTLRFHNNPYDPSGLYWKMDMSTLEVK